MSETRKLDAKAIVFGHSHVWPVRLVRRKGWSHPRVGIQVPVCGTKEFPGPMTYADDGGARRLNAVIAALLQKTSATQDADMTWMICMAQGNFYNQMGMLVEGRPFDFLQGDMTEQDLTPGAVVLPRAAVAQTMRARMAGMDSFLGLMTRTAFGARTIVVGPPRPPESCAKIEERLAREGLDTAEPPQMVSPAPVRLRLWHLQNTLMQALCDAHGVDYLDGGLPETVDDAGYLRAEMVKDPVHGNGRYAERLLGAVADRVLALQARKEAA